MTVLSVPQFPSSTTLLDQLEKDGVPIESHCRKGFCGYCRVKKLRGDVTYVTTPIAFVGDDEVLPCCCKASSDLTIEF